ncbi:hypothetical protein [uncultured Winogradskyella sp.]|uniref:hypothetical protein n=1 Tax=uncultured Winogradskyella sp. TaxID=395353 RepID=UPI002616FFE1|nr:hypothetical protein [uncultured Winogradskyella sp.]
MKLFNIARFKMIEGKRLKNYLLYALGEIILVVVGILIAVAINNNNASKTLNEDTLKIAKQIEEKLKVDLDTIKEVLSYIESEEKKYDRYLKKNKTTKERLEVRLEAPFLVTLQIQLLPINTVATANLEKVALNKTALSDKLIEIEQVYSFSIAGLRKMDAIITDEFISNINHIKNTYDWYEKLILPNSNFTVDEYKYFSSTDYKNRVVHMKFLYTNGYYGMIEEIEDLLKLRLKELQALL